MMISNLIKNKFNIPIGLINELIFWEKVSKIEDIILTKHLTRIQFMQKIHNNSKKTELVISKIYDIIDEYINNSSVNLIIYNIPFKSETVSDIDEIITDEHIMDTFSSYGSIYDIHIFKSTVYIWCVDDDSAKTISTKFNGMLIGKNILQTLFKKTNCLSKTYNWGTKNYEYLYNLQPRNVLLKLNNLNNTDYILSKL